MHLLHLRNDRPHTHGAYSEPAPSAEAPRNQLRNGRARGLFRTDDARLRWNPALLDGLRRRADGSGRREQAPRTKLLQLVLSVHLRRCHCCTDGDSLHPKPDQLDHRLRHLRAADAHLDGLLLRWRPLLPLRGTRGESFHGLGAGPCRSLQEASPALLRRRVLVRTVEQFSVAQQGGNARRGGLPVDTEHAEGDRGRQVDNPNAAYSLLRNRVKHGRVAAAYLRGGAGP
eukprot:TRINITY_DN706_c0_g1_i1.p2 TRINITY_DN706_c0_g1~~TRINITY_DN706_c0_g1_i1.p2  ORF type:complete len:229 (+),score=-13.77 TRINITY_DN706_c0_g1_i1:482-1168(+)